MYARVFGWDLSDVNKKEVLLGDISTRSQVLKCQVLTRMEVQLLSKVLANINVLCLWRLFSQASIKSSQSINYLKHIITIYLYIYIYIYISMYKLTNSLGKQQEHLHNLELLFSTSCYEYIIRFIIPEAVVNLLMRTTTLHQWARVLSLLYRPGLGGAGV